MKLSVKWLSVGQAQYGTIYLQRSVFFFWLMTNNRSKLVTTEEFVMNFILLIAAILAVRDISYDLLEKDVVNMQLGWLLPE